LIYNFSAKAQNGLGRTLGGMVSRAAVKRSASVKLPNLVIYHPRLGMILPRLAAVVAF
jgi:hypothetical protein